MPIDLEGQKVYIVESCDLHNFPITNNDTVYTFGRLDSLSLEQKIKNKKRKSSEKSQILISK